MYIHVIGNKGVVGSANQKTLSMNLEHEVTGSDKNEALPLEADIFLICVPEKIVPEVLESVFELEGLPVVRSTMRPDIINNINQKYTNHFCTNPEFLKAHTAFWDCYFPKGILIGDCCEEHGMMVEKMWEFLRVPVFHTTRMEASMVKLSSNVYAAMLISFWNNLKVICDRLGISVNETSRLLPILDERVSKYGTIAGSAYGGTCLPKDIKQLIVMCHDMNLDTDLFDSIEKINSLFTESTVSRGGL